jgi:hypothetical protein
MAVFGLWWFAFTEEKMRKMLRSKFTLSSQTSGAYIKAGWSSFNRQSSRLNIGHPGPFSMLFGMANSITKLNFLSAYITFFGQDNLRVNYQID